VTTVQIIGALATVLVTALGGPPLVKFVVQRFFHGREKRIDADVELGREREVTARHKLDLDVKLEGTTQQQVYELQAWMRAQLETLQKIDRDRAQELADLRAENRALRLKVEELIRERDQHKKERDELEVRVKSVIAQGQDLLDRLNARDREVSQLKLERDEAAKMLAARDKTIREMTTRLDAEIEARARCENENERLRTRGKVEAS